MSPPGITNCSNLNESFILTGDNYQESDSPSWFNPQEALQTVQYLKQVLDLGIDLDDIGIISPYRKQAIYLASKCFTL